MPTFLFILHIMFILYSIHFEYFKNKIQDQYIIKVNINHIKIIFIFGLLLSITGLAFSYYAAFIFGVVLTTISVMSYYEIDNIIKKINE